MITKHPFGNTGHDSTRVIFGAAGLGTCSQGFADEVLETVVNFGVNHIDTAASYGDAEERIAPWMQTHRSEFFLATKTEDRDGVGARASLERSLTRLGVDKVDLIQLHNLVEPEEWEQVHRKGGALEALVSAKDEGLVDFIGVTGHGTRIPTMHIRSLEEFPYDSVLFPYNYAMLSNPIYRDSVEHLIEICTQRNVAVQTIKSVARGRWSSDSLETTHFSWYEPLEEDLAIQRAVSFVLGRNGIFLNTSSDYRLLKKTLETASFDIEVPSEELMEQDLHNFGIKPLFDGESLELI